MAVSSSILDYTGRTVDLLVFDGADGSRDVLVAQQLFSESHAGKVVSGIYKLAQKFLLLLLTEKGSQQYAPDYGTEFMTQLRSGVRTTLEAEQVFQSALIDIHRILKSEETDSDPADERYATASTVNILLRPGGVMYRIRLESEAGTARVVLLPIEINPLAPSREFNR